MKLNRKTVFWGIFATLLLASTASSALTLGRMRGAALLGKPLDLLVPVQYGTDEDVAANCFEADVSYGDTPLERSRVSIRLQPSAQAGNLVVHVTSNASVDEAVVRMTLRTVCNPKTSRNYTVLADVVSEPVGAGTAAAAVANRVAPVDRPVTETKIAPAASGQNSTAASTAASGSKAPVAQAPADEARAAERRAARAAARKQVAAADTGAAVASSAKAKNQVNAAALEDLQRRVDEIAKWQASNGEEERQKNEARAKALEDGIRGLQAVTAKNQQSIQMVANAMESSSSDNYGRTLVYALGAVLLLCFGALLYVASRMRAGGPDAAPWWSGEQAQPPVAVPQAAAEAFAAKPPKSMPAALEAAPEPMPSAAPTTWPAAIVAPTAHGDLGPSMDFTAAVAAAAGAGGRPAAKGKSARPDFSPSGPGNLKSINTKEMLDVRQQAEFFMALGQHDEAVRLLESHINGSADSNPLVLLDLLKIFHTLSRRAEFERYREEFNAQFTGRIPPYASFLQEGNGLEAYEDICHQIVVLWPTEYTVDFIEQCLVRLPEDDPEQGMDLEAFRDLLLLYGILKRLDQGYDSNLAPFSTSRSDNLSQQGAFSATSMDGGATEPLPVLAGNYAAATTPAPVAAAASALDLDLDLNLDVGPEASSSGGQNNLIDFDMSDYMAQKKSESSKK